MRPFSIAVISLSVSLSAAVLPGCAAFNYGEPDSPAALVAPTPITPRPRLAVVLGSGGPLTLIDLNPSADRGWIRGQRLQDYVTDQLQGQPIEALATPLIVVATRRDTKQPVLFMRGHTGVAVRASSAVPNVISPVGINGIEYEDADVSLPLAVSVARAAGAQFVIAVDVSAHENSAPPETPSDWLDRDNARRARIAPQGSQADFLIHPDLGYRASPAAAYAQMARTRGEETARQAIPALVAAIKGRFVQ